MIAHPKKQVCASCNSWFAPSDLHPVVIAGKSKLFCYRCPSPIEIRQRCWAIQAGWSASIEHSRRAKSHQCGWRPPRVIEAER